MAMLCNIAMETSRIYTITNRDTNRVYVGATDQNYEDRWDGHRYDARSGRCPCVKFHNALKKYGSDAFIWAAHSEHPGDAAWDLEDLVIEYYKTLPGGVYNLKRGGRYGKHSDETKRKMSSSSKGKPKSESHRLSMLGKIRSETHKQKLSDVNRGKKHTEEAKLKMSAAKKGSLPWNKGKKPSIESRRKMSASHIGKPLSEEHKRKIAEATSGRKVSEETKLRMSKPKSEEAKRNMRQPKSEAHKQALRDAWVIRKARKAGITDT